MTSERDEAWFAGVYRQHQADVLRYARRRVHPHEVDDVVAEVFMTAWRRRDEVPDLGRLWLLATARHVVMHMQRSGSRRRRLDDAAVAPATQEHFPDAVMDISAALRRLAPADREILMLVAWDGLTATEAAAVLACSTVAARARLSRARRRLAAHLDLSSSPASEMT